VDFAQEHGHKPLAGFILGAYALGSAVGGLWYGSRHWRAPVHRRFAITLCLMSAATAAFWAMPGLATSVGVAAGSAIAGQVIDADGARWGYVLAASCGAAATTVCLSGLRVSAMVPWRGEPAEWADAEE
jgi:hypothetical protein